MGAFYGSLHFRTAEHASVRELLVADARAKKTRFYLAPATDGWTGAYPSNHGQDERLGKRIAKRFDGELLHVMVHDDDVFAYSYYRGGKLIDRYNSIPEYFGDVSDREKAKLRGQPERLAHLLESPTMLPQLEQLLHGPQPAFATESLQRFAELLRLPNAVSSYEYLADGETDDIANFDQWIHVPDLSREQARQRDADAALQREKDALRERGVLLLEQKADGKGFSSPLWCPDDTGRGFLVYWSIFPSKDAEPLLRYAPPFSAPPARTGFELGAVNDIVLSPSGRYIAVVESGMPQSVGVWDVETRIEIVRVPHSRVASYAAFNHDETLLATIGDELILTRFPDGTRLATIDAQRSGRRGLCFHPDGRYLVLEEQHKIAIIDCSDACVVKTLFAGGVQDLGSLYKVMGQQLQRALQQANPPAPGATDPEFVRKYVEEMTSALSAGHVPGQTNALQGSHSVMALRFTADGKRLLCCSNRGLHVYDWDAVLAAEQSTPDAVFDVEGKPLEQRGPVIAVDMAYEYACVHDPVENRVIFAGMAGSIRSLDLTSGAVETLLDLPGKPPISKMELSRDRSALACTTRPEMFARRGGDAQVLQIFSYPALLEAGKA